MFTEDRGDADSNSWQLTCLSPLMPIHKTQGRRKQFLVGGGEVCTDATQHQQFWLILQNVLHIGNIQMVQLKYFKVPLPKEIFVTTINPKFS